MEFFQKSCLIIVISKHTYKHLHFTYTSFYAKLYMYIYILNEYLTNFIIGTYLHQILYYVISRRGVKVTNANEQRLVMTPLNYHPKTINNRFTIIGCIPIRLLSTIIKNNKLMNKRFLFLTQYVWHFANVMTTIKMNNQSNPWFYLSLPQLSLDQTIDFISASYLIKIASHSSTIICAEIFKNPFIIQDKNTRLLLNIPTSTASSKKTIVDYFQSSPKRVALRSVWVLLSEQHCSAYERGNINLEIIIHKYIYNTIVQRIGFFAILRPIRDFEKYALIPYAAAAPPYTKNRCSYTDSAPGSTGSDAMHAL